MVTSQAPDSVKTLLQKHINSIPGPKGDLTNEPYVYPMLNRCDAIAMFYYDGSLLYAWSQDNLNLFYWHADFDETTQKSQTSYEYVQSDGTALSVESESKVVENFIAKNVNYLFFNGCKFHLTKRDVWDDGIVYTVLGGSDGRGLLTAISPDGYYMVVVAASTYAYPTEHFLGIDSGRPQGLTKRELRELHAEFSVFAPLALGI